MSELTLTRDCQASVIPSGDLVVLEKGAVVHVTQALGGSVTVRTPMGLFRIASGDLDALGTEAASRYAAAPSAPAAAGPLDEDMLWEALKGCFDPEIPVNIVDLGLVYHLDLTEGARGKRVAVKMTLTAQGCGMGPVIAGDAKARLESLPGVESAEVEIVWDPVWNPRMISEEGRQQLGLE